MKREIPALICVLFLLSLLGCGGGGGSSSGGGGNPQPTVATITLTAPTGGESWTVGDAHALTWTSQNLSGTITLALSTDGGGSFGVPIAANVAVTDGTFNWTVPSNTTSQAVIRIVSDSDGTVLDESAPFDIQAPPTLNNPPTQPTALYVDSDDAQSGSSGDSSSPVVGVDLDPVFSAVFNDVDAGDTASTYRIQVHTDPNFSGASMWLTPAAGAAITSVTAGDRCVDIAYGGSALSHNTTYYWRLIFQDAAGDWSAISDTGAFTTTVGQVAPAGFVYDPQGSNTVEGWAYDHEATTTKIDVYVQTSPIHSAQTYLARLNVTGTPTGAQDTTIRNWIQSNLGVSPPAGYKFMWGADWEQWLLNQGFATASGTYTLRFRVYDQQQPSTWSWMEVDGTGVKDFPISVTVPYPVPIPKPININYTLGCIYMPKPRNPSHQWSRVKLFNSADEIKTDGGQRMPLLGYYQGDSPEALDWQIKWAVDRGIEFFVFDDYWTESKSSPLYDQSVEALLAAQYKDYMYFAMELTTMSTATESKESKRALLVNKVLPYYINNYFNQGNYLIVHGKPFIHVLSFWSVFGTSDANYVRGTIQQCNQLIAANTQYSGAYWATNDLQKSSMDFSTAKSAGFEGVMPYYGLPWLFPSADRNQWPITLTSTDPNQDWPDGVAYSTLRSEGINIHRDAFAEAQSEGMHFITGISTDFDSREVWWDTHQLYFKDQNPGDYWNFLANVKNLIDTHPGQVPTVTNTGKPMVGLGPWNEQLECSSIEPGYSEFQSGTNKSPFYVASAAANVFGGPGGYDTDKPSAPVSLGFQAKDTWTFGGVNSGDTDFWHISTDGFLTPMAGDTDRLTFDRLTIMQAATKLDTTQYSKLKIQVSPVSGSYDKIVIHYRNLDYSDNADAYEAPLEPGKQIYNAVLQKLSNDFTTVGGHREYTFNLGGAQWKGNCIYIEVRFQPSTGTSSVDLKKIWFE